MSVLVVVQCMTVVDEVSMIKLRDVRADSAETISENASRPCSDKTISRFATAIQQIHYYHNKITFLPAVPAGGI